MGRQHPEYCEHDFCIDPGDESFGLTEQECPFCAAAEYPEMAARIAQLQQEVATLTEWKDRTSREHARALAAEAKNVMLRAECDEWRRVVGKWARLNARYSQDAPEPFGDEYQKALHDATCALLAHYAEAKEVKP